MKYWLILFVACISFGPVHNLFGSAGVIMALLVLLLMSRSVVFPSKCVTVLIWWCVFLLIKSIGAIGTTYISEYHGANRVLSGMVLLTCISFCVSLLTPLFVKNKEIVAKAFLLFFHASVAINLIFLLINGRNTYRLNEETGGVLLSSQFFVFGAIIIVMLLLSCFFNKKKYTYLALAALDFIYIITANYTIQILFAILSCGIVIAYYQIHDKRKRGFVLVLLTIVIIVGVPMLPVIIGKVGDAFFHDNTIVLSRLNELQQLLKKQSLQGTDLYSRLSLMQMSFNSFKDNILFGIPFNLYNTVQTGQNVGGHSEWIDDLARFGLLGMILLFAFLFRIVNHILNIMDDNKPLKICVMGVVVLYGFANPFLRYQELLMIYLSFICMDYFISSTKYS